MNFLRGQDDFFQTANQPISVRNLSQPDNKQYYCNNFLGNGPLRNPTLIFKMKFTMMLHLDRNTSKVSVVTKLEQSKCC